HEPTKSSRSDLSDEVADCFYRSLAGRRAQTMKSGVDLPQHFNPVGQAVRAWQAVDCYGDPTCTITKGFKALHLGVSKRNVSQQQIIDSRLKEHPGFLQSRDGQPNSAQLNLAAGDVNTLVGLRMGA